MLLPDPWNEIQSFKKPPAKTPTSFKKPQSFKKPPSKKPVSFKKTPAKTPTSFRKPPSFKKPAVPPQEGFNPIRWFQQKFNSLGTSQQNPRIKVNLNSNPNSVRIKPDISNTVKIAPKVTPTGVNGIAPGVRTAAPVVFGALDAGNQIAQGENPLMATARAAARGLGGGLTSAGALLAGAEGTPMDIYTGGLAYTAGANEADKYFNKGIELLGLRSEIGRDKRTINGKLYDMGIPEHKTAYDAALKKAQTPNQGEVPITGFDTLTPTQIKEAKTLANSDGERSNGNGVVQKGRNLSAINSAYADLFEGTTYKGDKFTPSIYNPFESNHLNTGESRQDLLDMGVDSDVADNFMAGGTSEWDSDTDTYRQIAPINLQTTEGSPDIVQSGTQKIVEGVNGTIFGAEDEVPETIKRSRTSTLRRKYLLHDLKDKDGKDMSTVQRIRLMRLEQGAFGGFGNRQLGGSPDISTPNMSTPISEQQYQQYVAGDDGASDVAQELMEKYKAGLKNNG